MRAVIIGGGAIGDYEKARKRILPDDYIICADAGYDHAVRMGIAPDILIGDFDSISGVPDDTELVKYPTRKDFTDSHIAMELAREKGYENMLLLGFTGDRADHTLTNILLLTRFQGAVIADDNNEILPLTDEVEICGDIGDTVSIIPIRGDLTGVTTEGLEYPLRDETLRAGESRGVSNVMTAEKCRVSIKGGAGVVIKVDRV